MCFIIKEGNYPKLIWDKHIPHISCRIIKQIFYILLYKMMLFCNVKIKDRVFKKTNVKAFTDI